MLFACGSSDIIAIGNEAHGKAPEQACETDLLRFSMYGNEFHGRPPEEAWDIAIAAFPMHQ